MRKCGICEERGSGYDKIVTATSSGGLPAPRVGQQQGRFTRATIFSKVPFDLTSKEDRVRTCYMQACLASVTAEGTRQCRRARAVRAFCRRQGEGVPCDSGYVGA